MRHNVAAVQTAIQDPSLAVASPKQTAGNRRPSPEQRAAFFTALGQGHSAAACARMVGVSPQTGQDWAKQARVRRAEQQARSVLIATKTDIAAELTRIALHEPDVAPRDKVNAVATLSKVMGYDAPTRSEQVIVHASVTQWIEAQRIAAGAHGSAQRVIAAGGDPPIEASAESFSPPPIIPKNSESSDK